VLGDAVAPLGGTLIQVLFHYVEHVIEREPGRPTMRFQRPHL
jgi:hypothetical protein